MTVAEAFHQRILELCAQQDTTLSALAVDCKIPQSTLENPKAAATIVTVKKICDALNVDLVEFFDTDTFNVGDLELE